MGSSPLRFHDCILVVFGIDSPYVGREDVYATAVKQVGENRFLICFSNVAQFVDFEGNAAVNAGDVEKVVFEVQPDTVGV